MKRFCVVLAVVSLLLCASGCGQSEQGSLATAPPPTASTATPGKDAPIAIPKATDPVALSPQPMGDLGNFYVEIRELQISEDHNGNSVAIITYSFTNNSEESIMPAAAVSDSAYQNGVELETAFLYNKDGYDFDADTRKIQSGVSVDIPVAFYLSSDTAPIEFEVSKIASLGSEIVCKTFEIAEGGVTELSVAPKGNIDFEVGEFSVSVVSYRISEDYSGAPILVLELGVTNNGNSARGFMFSVDLTAFQNGIELSSAFSPDDVDQYTQGANLKPGNGVAVYCAYVLADESPVTFELSELFSFDSQVQTFTIDITQ